MALKRQSHQKANSKVAGTLIKGAYIQSWEAFQLDFRTAGSQKRPARVNMSNDVLVDCPGSEHILCSMTLTKEQRFEALVQIVSGLLAGSPAKPTHNSAADEAEAYLAVILDRVERAQ